MNRELARIHGVLDAVAQAAPPLTDSRPAEDFDDLYRRTFGRAYAYAASLLRDRSAAEEVTAQAFERAYRNRRSFRPRRGSVDSWLFGIVRNAALDELRKRGRRAALEAEPPDLEAAAADNLVADAERRAAVRSAVAGLEPRDRELLALKFAGGLAKADIARVLGISESNVGTRLHRVLERLREECDEKH